ncbi:uncharacterized protein LOC143539202 [Bidens hawaiensis]|uniref:uncharacterized protein LOC143539202 n=1 Tax=Bidens hawaiensis TaxID=980011 RepID=UPI0040492AF4
MSLPTTSHDPSADSIKKELNGIETWVMSSTCKPSVETIYDGLMKLSRLYECLHEFINLLCSTRNGKCGEELMDRLVGFLDVCDIIRDIMSLYKEHVRDLQCASRRRKGDSSIPRYNCFRKMIKKDVKRLIASLKQSKAAKSPDHHHQHEAIKRVIEVTVSVFETLLMPFVTRSSQTPKANKWSIVVSKLIQRTKVSCEEHHYQNANDVEGWDAVLRGQCIEDDRFSTLWNDVCIWEAMEAQIERIEDGLECILRSLIRTRASLLNVVSNY